MKFGAMVVPRAGDWQLFAELEQTGYDSAWVPDSQMIYSDTYPVLALAAANTSRVRLGPGVADAQETAALRQLGVNSRSSSPSGCPLCLRKRTSESRTGMSAKGQFETHAVQQTIRSSRQPHRCKMARSPIVSLSKHLEVAQPGRL